MSDDPKRPDDPKEFKRLKDNAGLENKHPDVARPDHAPPGQKGTTHYPAPGGMGSPSFHPAKPRQQEQRPQAPIAPPSKDGQQREFKRRDEPQQEQPGRSQPSPGEKGPREFEKRDLTREFNDRSR